VDVQGEALSLLILPRLPFSVPSEPVLEARVEAIERRGGNSFAEYSIPSAVIRFKQGFGRLIRSRSDRGAALILDSRVVRQYYGKAFLNSLPEHETWKGRLEQLWPAMAGFFSSPPPSQS
jgi:ATP-dependent DNA helicase DinG